MTHPHLSEAERAALLELIAADPLASCAAIAGAFEARTGRRVARCTVRRAWVHGYRPVGSPDPTGRLSEAERAVLLDLCGEFPDSTSVGIARRFAAATGRDLSPVSVGRFRRSRLGELRPRGRPRKATP